MKEVKSTDMELRRVVSDMFVVPSLCTIHVRIV